MLGWKTYLIYKEHRSLFSVPKDKSDSKKRTLCVCLIGPFESHIAGISSFALDKQILL